MGQYILGLSNTNLSLYLKKTWFQGFHLLRQEIERGDVILKATATNGGNELKESFSMAIGFLFI